MSDDPKPLHERRIWEFQALRDILVIAILLAVLWLGARLDFITAPLLFGLGLAYLFEPVIRRLAALPRMNRMRAVLAVVVAGLLAGLLLLALVVPPLVRQVVNLANNSERYVTSARAWITAEQRPAWLRERAAAIDGVLGDVGLGKADAADKPATPAAEPVVAPASAGTTSDEERIRAIVRSELANAAPPAAGGDLSSKVKSALATLWNAAATVFGGIFSIVLFVVIAAFIAASCMLRWPEVLEFGHSLIPNRARERVLPLIGRMDATVSSFIRGRITVAAIVGCIYAIGWTIVGVPYGLVLGLAVGAFSIIPYLAAIGLPAAWVLLAMSLIANPGSGGWYVSGPEGTPEITWWMVLVLPWIVNLVAQSLEDYVLNPLIQGKATELHPVVIMLAVLAGGSLAGLYGMLLAVPVAACIRILLSAELMPRLRRWAGAEETATPG